MNVNMGGIPPAAGRPTNPEQDAVLDQMRDAARGDANGQRRAADRPYG